MDIERLKKFAENEFEAGKFVKAVTAYKNTLKDKEQMHDVAMSDHFKMLRDPLIKQQKKTDEKQDKVIEQLQKNQKALTSGLQEIMALNQEEFLEAPDFLEDPKKPASEEEGAVGGEEEKTKEYHDVNFNDQYNDEEKAILKKLDLYLPNKLISFNSNQLQEEEKKINKLYRDKSEERGRNPTTEKGIKKREVRLAEADVVKKFLDDIHNTIKIKKFPTVKKGKGLKQPKRNAYKIQDGKYGGMAIDIPKLFNEMRVNVFRGGKLIYDAHADKSLINLLTKRFNPKTKYSINAVKIFNDLNTLSNMPKHRSSGQVTDGWVKCDIL